MPHCKIIRLKRESKEITSASIGRKGRETIDVKSVLETLEEFYQRVENTINDFLNIGYTIVSSNHYVPIMHHKFSTQLPTFSNPDEMEFIVVLQKV